MGERIDEIGFGGLKLIQDPMAFCYGIDAVLLAAFAGEHPAENRSAIRILDLGTNNAVIPLILSRLLPSAVMTGVEKQDYPAKLATRSVELNGLGDRIRILHTDILNLQDDLEPDSFDMVVCNPPYMERGTGLINDSDLKTVARHETTAGLEDFVACASRFLRDRGFFYMIHRPARIVDISCACRNYHLEPKMLRFVQPHEGERPNQLLIACRKNGRRNLKILDPLTVYRSDGSYTDEVLNIYRRNREGQDLYQR